MTKQPYRHEEGISATDAMKAPKTWFRSLVGMPLKGGWRLSQRLVFDPLAKAGVALSCVCGVMG